MGKRTVLFAVGVLGILLAACGQKEQELQGQAAPVSSVASAASSENPANDDIRLETEVSGAGPLDVSVHQDDRGLYLRVPQSEPGKAAEYLVPGPSTGIMRIEWIDETRIGLAGHVNPSTSSYLLFDAKNGKWLQEYYGGGFTWADGEFYYYETQPHFSETRGKDRLLNGRGEVLYESPDRMSIWGNALYFNESGSRVAFFESDADRGSLQLIAASVSKLRELRVMERMEWDLVQGDVHWDSDTRITVSNDEFSVTVDLRE